ncbi:MAG: hypothetical protein WEC82_05615, partial [Xanthobacteraceae bacterium]
QFFEQLGRAAVFWSAVESLLAEFLSYLLKADPGSMYVLNQTVSTEQLLKWIGTLVEIQLSNRPDIAELLERIEDSRQDRNAYIHGVWGTDSPLGTVLIQTVRLNRSTVTRSEIVTLADLNDLVERIEDLVADLSALGKNLGFFR